IKLGFKQVIGLFSANYKNNKGKIGSSVTTKWSILCVFMVLGLSAFKANATNKRIYVCQDEHCVLVFSESPRKGAEKVKLNSPAMCMPST
ncbi:hypothetical protein CWC07_19080, partial [Pseudoalteromonas ruthenica]